MQFFVGKSLVFSWFVSFPDETNLVASLFKMSVKTIVGNINFSVCEPSHIEVLCVVAIVTIHDLVPFLEPVNILLSNFCPEGIRIFYGLFPHFVILITAINVSLFSEAVGYRINLLKSNFSHLLPPIRFL